MTNTYTTTVTITDERGIRRAVAVLSHERFGTMNVVERAFLAKDVSDETIVMGMNDRAACGVLRWDAETEALEDEFPYGEFPATEERGVSADAYLEEAMLSGDYNATDTSGVDALVAFMEGDDMDNLTDEEK